MYVTAFEVRGLRDLPEFRAEGLGRVVRILGPSPQSTALGDALELAFAAFSDDALARLLHRWGVIGEDAELEIDGGAFPDQALWTDRQAAGALVVGESRDVVVRLELQLDPLIFRDLRDRAAREPRLVTALADGPRAAVTVGALFTRSLDGLALSIQSFEVGSESFATNEADRPPWLTQLLQRLGGRFARHADRTRATLAAEVLEASLSWNGHSRYMAWQRSLKDGVGAVRAAQGPEGGATLLADDLPLRRHGDQAWQRSDLAATVHLSGADIVWAELADSWLEQAVEGDSSPLEQVWRVCPEGGLDPTLPPPPPDPRTVPRRRLEFPPRPAEDAAPEPESEDS